MISTLEGYKKQVGEHKEKISQQAPYHFHQAYAKPYVLSKANRLFFMGEPVDDHRDFFSEYQLNRELFHQIETQTEYSLLLDFLHAKGDTSFLKDIHKQPYLFCSFHFGAYNLVSFMLKKLGVDFSLIAKKEVNIEDVVKFKRDASTANYSEKSDTIKADFMGALLETIQKIKHGKSILSFIDGGDGASGVNDHKKSVEVDFLNKKLFVKRGIPEIAYNYKVPVVPVVACREADDEISVFFYPPVHAADFDDKSSFTRHVMQYCYNQLEEHVVQKPEQWEAWDCIHASVNFKAPSLVEEQKKSFWNSFSKLIKPKNKPRAKHKASLTTPYLTFNTERYGVYPEGDSYLLTDTHTYGCFKISVQLKEILEELAEQPEETHKVKLLINHTLLSDLTKNEVLIGTDNRD